MVRVVFALFSFIEWYKRRLELATPHIDCTSNISNDEVSSLLGCRKNYYTLLAHYETLFETSGHSLEKLIAENFPSLSAGLAGSALHGLIQLGYGYAAQSARFESPLFFSVT